MNNPQDLLSRLREITREIETVQLDGPPMIACSLEHAIEDVGDAMTLLLLPTQVTELRRRTSPAARSTASSHGSA